ncbi:response regulator transcription factor [Sphingomonas sp. CARO-RG-8B-R24-01]|uniref:response regulator transcription factor n=1 Tax=Sphingomonas sp. CARO-RG-8B-R24-01 TaxID=2914831 RepID=UPI001F56F43E|nr:response regulator transcription factor [Sphingomonas sp. CARO-RG-8B-R24-01]
MRLLLVEDDRELAEALAAALARRGMSSDHAATADDALLMLGAARYSAVVLDLGLPDADGLDVLRTLRSRQDPVPVVILTARGDTAARIGGLDHGADDYLAKPFDVEELVARLRAVLRRQGGFAGAELTVGNVRFDSVARELTVEARVVTLSARELELVDLLLKRPGRVVVKALIEDQLFGLSETLGSNAVEVYVHRLRRKLEQAGASVVIETIRGVGYMLRAAA